MGAANVEHNGHIVRPQVLVLQQPPHHGGEKIGHFRGNSRGGLQAVHGREKRAKDVAHRIDQEEALCIFGGHVNQICRASSAAIVGPRAWQGREISDRRVSSGLMRLGRPGRARKAPIAASGLVRQTSR